MKTKILFIFLLCLFFTGITHAQVTIGSGKDPDASAILDLKNQDNNTSTKGFLLPRVVIADTTLFGLEGNSNTEGMVVYNTTANTKNNGKGLYFWNGSRWVYLKGSNTQTEWSQGGNTNGAVKTLGTKDNYDLPFITNNTEKMRIATSGNVGVGTTTPKAKFSVSGGPISQDDYAAGDKLLMMGYSNSQKIANDPGLTFGSYSGSLVGSDGASPQNANTGQFTWNVGDVSNTWREVMRLQNNGFLGIGTKTPSAQLHVVGTTRLEGQVTLPTIATAAPVDKVLTVDANGVVKRTATTIPQRYSFQMANVTPGTSATVIIPKLSGYSTLTVTTSNACGDVSIASYLYYNGLLVFSGGRARDQSYTYTVNDPAGNSLGMTAVLTTPCTGLPSQFNYQISVSGTNVTIQNNGSSTLTYDISDVEF